MCTGMTCYRVALLSREDRRTSLADEMAMAVVKLFIHMILPPTLRYLFQFLIRCETSWIAKDCSMMQIRAVARAKRRIARWRRAEIAHVERRLVVGLRRVL